MTFSHNISGTPVRLVGLSATAKFVEAGPQLTGIDRVIAAFQRAADAAKSRSPIDATAPRTLSASGLRGRARMIAAFERENQER